MSLHDLSIFLLYPSPAAHFKTFQVLLIHFPKCLSLNTEKETVF